MGGEKGGGCQEGDGCRGKEMWVWLMSREV